MEKIPIPDSSNSGPGPKPSSNPVHDPTKCPSAYSNARLDFRGVCPPSASTPLWVCFPWSIVQATISVSRNPISGGGRTRRPHRRRIGNWRC